MAAALRAAGASESVIRNPDRVFKSVGFAKELERVGLSDNVIAKKYSTLMNASSLQKEIFYAEVIKTEKVDGVEVDVYKNLTDKEIKAIIEGPKDNPTGCRVVYTKTFANRKEVSFRTPDSNVQRSIIELVGKVKSHFAPNQHEVKTHELDESERQFLQGLMSE